MNRPATDDGTQTTEERSAEQDFDREGLEKKVSGLLDEAFIEDDEEEESSLDTDTEETEDTSEEDDTGEFEEEAEDDTASEDDDESQETEEAAAEDDEHEGPSDAPTLPEAHRRSLYAYGWEDAEIDQNLRTLGDQFLKTAERIHSNRNAELQDWAKAGRNAREQQESGDDQQTAQPTKGSGQKTEDGSLPSQLQSIDKDQLKKQYGEDELIDNLVDPINQTVNAINQVLPVVQQSQQQVEQQRVQQVQQEVESFFGREDLQPYTELYGGKDQTLSDEQVQARNEVLDTAYDLMVGAQQVHGRQLQMGEALEHAHEIVASKTGHKSKVAQQGIKKQAKQRNRGISRKPSRKTGSGTKAANGRPQTREELEKVTRQRMKKALAE